MSKGCSCSMDMYDIQRFIKEEKNRIKLYYTSFSMVVNNSTQWTLSGNFSPDLILGMSVAGLILLNGSGYFIAINGFTNQPKIISKLDDIEGLGENGGYIEYRNIPTDQVLELVPDSEIYDILAPGAKFRKLKPDDGTTGIWTYHNYDTWNMIITDDVKEFMTGFISICDSFNVNAYNYIMGTPVQSEGELVPDWESMLS